MVENGRTDVEPQPHLPEFLGSCLCSLRLRQFPVNYRLASLICHREGINVHRSEELSRLSFAHQLISSSLLRGRRFCWAVGFPVCKRAAKCGTGNSSWKLRAVARTAKPGAALTLATAWKACLASGTSRPKDMQCQSTYMTSEKKQHDQTKNTKDIGKQW